MSDLKSLAAIGLVQAIQASALMGCQSDIRPYVEKKTPKENKEHERRKAKLKAQRKARKRSRK